MGSTQASRQVSCLQEGLPFAVHFEQLCTCEDTPVQTQGLHEPQTAAMQTCKVMLANAGGVS